MLDRQLHGLCSVTRFLEWSLEMHTACKGKLLMLPCFSLVRYYMMVTWSLAEICSAPRSWCKGKVVSVLGPPVYPLLYYCSLAPWVDWLKKVVFYHTVMLTRI